ncbi:hypothetical protein JCM11491_004305 [Sporobolomyces phaffii]
MPIPPLPNELVDQILSYKCLERAEFYAACLVARSWLEPARKSLYSAVDFFIIRFVDLDGNPYPRQDLYRYSTGSWSLLRTLIENPHLASLVEVVRVNTFRNLSREPSSVFTTRESFLSTIIPLLHSATSYQFSYSAWLDADVVGSYFPHFDRIQHLHVEATSGSDTWGTTLSQLTGLRSFSTTYGGLDLHTPFESFVSGLRHLSLANCNREDLALAVSTSKRTLRTLSIPCHLLLDLEILHYPNLSRLSLTYSTSSRASQWEGVPDTSLKYSQSITTLDLSPAAVKLLLGNGRSLLVNVIPPTCTRINLSNPVSLDTVVSAVAKSSKGHRIRSLGVPDSVRQPQRPEKSRLLAAGLRSIVEEAQVELVWY